MTKTILFTSIFIFFFGSVFGQMTREEYIENYRHLAIKEMRDFKIPASITMAQGILESNNGNSDLARKAKNHFGIKCNGWEGKTYHQDDDEKDECFRRYESVEDSYRDHSLFLKRDRYAKLYEYEITDYKAWARGLKKAGYATNPRYAELLVKLIEDHKLYRLDDIAYQDSLFQAPLIALDDTIEPSLQAFFEEQKAKQKMDEGVNPDAFIIKGKGHEIQYNNRVKYIITREGDSFKSLNKEFDLIPFQLPKYNELPKDFELQANMILYLQPKRKKAEKDKDQHVVREGDSLYSISQLYAIKLKKLKEMNGIQDTTPIKPGDILILRPQKRSLF